MTLNSTTKRIQIDAPDAPAAFALEQRLAHFCPTTVGAGLGWTVELEDADDRLEEIEAAVKQWLRQIDLRSTVVRVDSTTETIVERATPELPLGVGYDGPYVLTHEP